MQNRIKMVRKEAGLNMRDFAEKLGVSHGAISLIESGQRNVTGQMVKSICREFDVNEEWLLTGVGEMHAPQSREDQMGELFAGMIKDPDKNRELLLSAIASEMRRMNPDQTMMVRDFIIGVADKLKE